MAREQRFGSQATLEALVRRGLATGAPKRVHERLLAVLQGAAAAAAGEREASKGKGAGAHRMGSRAAAEAVAAEGALHKTMCKNYKVRCWRCCCCCCCCCLRRRENIGRGDDDNFTSYSCVLFDVAALL